MALVYEQEPARPEPRPDGGRRPVGSLVRELVDEASALVRAEAALAKTEIQENVTEVKRGITSLGAGAAVAHLGAMALVAALILVLAIPLPAWLAALVVGLVLAAIGAGLLAWGRTRARASAMVPERTVRSLEQGREMVREEGARAMEGMR